LIPETENRETAGPRTAAGVGDLASVEESVLPLSGLRMVLTHRGSRQTLEIDDEQGRLVGVISDSPLDPAVVRGAWRGVHGGQPWALVIGRRDAGQVAVTFSSSRRRLFGLAGRQAEISDPVTPGGLGGFWIAEAAVDASRATVAVAGVTADSLALQLVG
jgi:hypothetical protein